MNELDVQNKIKAAVVAASGAAHKLSTPFKIGICDLLIKLPDCPATLAEVKLAKYKARIPGHHVFRLAVTHNQMAFLAGFEAAGMTCGVISAIQTGRELRLAMFSLDAVRAMGYTATVSDHLCIASSVDIVELLHRFCHEKGGSD